MRFSYWVGKSSVPLPPLGGSLQRFRPIVPVRVTSPGGSALRDGLLDTGSDDTVFPAVVAQTINLDLSQAPQLAINLEGRGAVLCQYAQVRLLLTDYIEIYEWDAIVGFVSVPLSRPLLGYAGFLQFFDAEFRGANKEVILTPNRDFPGKVS